MRDTAPAGTTSKHPRTATVGHPIVAPTAYLCRAFRRKVKRSQKLGVVRAQVKGPGHAPRPLALRCEGFSALGVGPYLAVDALHEALAVLVALLELAQLLELICGKVVELLGDLRDGQPLVVVRLQGTKHAGAKLRLAGGLLGLAQDLLGPLGGLLGNPQPLPTDLLGGPQSLLGGLLDDPHALLGVIEGG